MVASGATEVLTGCMLGLIEPGDEVVLIEPLYDCYLPIIRRAGGVPKMVRVEPPDWTLPKADCFARGPGSWIRSRISPRSSFGLNRPNRSPPCRRRCG